MTEFRDQLYTFHFGKAERYDPVFDSWSTLNSVSRDSALVTVVRGEIYALGVDTYSKKKSTIARYDVERCLWQTVLSSHEGCTAESCVVAAGNHLYVLGGKPSYPSHPVTTAERFDTVENKWEEIADMQQARSRAFGVATKGKVFVVGGREGPTCEMYNISTNEWQFFGSLNVNREWGTMVCLKGTLYVLGGKWYNWSRSDLSVERYDPTEDKWIQKTTIPLKTITGCSMKLSKGVLNKLHVIEE